MMQDRTFKIDSPLKITQVAMLSPLSKTQNSFMKPNEDQEIQKGFTFQSKTRPPTLGKDGQRPILQNQLDAWNDSVFSAESASL